MNRREYLRGSMSCVAGVTVLFCAARARSGIKSNEVVSSILVTADRMELIAITNHFQYAFPLPSGLRSILKAPFHQNLRIKFSAFQVDKSGRTIGTLDLSLNTTADSVVIAAVAWGFATTADGAVYTLTTQGIRFAAHDVDVAEQYKLDKTYQVQVDDDPKGSSPPSPMVVAADKLAMFGKPLVVAPPEFTSR